MKLVAVKREVLEMSLKFISEELKSLEQMYNYRSFTQDAAIAKLSEEINKLRYLKQELEECLK